MRQSLSHRSSLSKVRFAVSKNKPFGRKSFETSTNMEGLINEQSEIYRVVDRLLKIHLQPINDQLKLYGQKLFPEQSDDDIHLG
jgi:hypothetical protein